MQPRILGAVLPLGNRLSSSQIAPAMSRVLRRQIRAGEGTTAFAVSASLLPRVVSGFYREGHIAWIFRPAATSQTTARWQTPANARERAFDKCSFSHKKIILAVPCCAADQYRSRRREGWHVSTPPGMAGRCAFAAAFRLCPLRTARTTALRGFTIATFRSAIYLGSIAGCGVSAPSSKTFRITTSTFLGLSTIKAWRSGMFCLGGSCLALKWRQLETISKSFYLCCDH